jgi:hypothetical protein
MGGETEWGLPLRHLLSSLLPREPECPDSVLLSSSDAPELDPEDCLTDATFCSRDSRGCSGDTTGVTEVVVPGGRGKPNTCLVGGAFNRGDMSPFLGDLGGRRGEGRTMRERKRADYTALRTGCPPFSHTTDQVLGSSRLSLGHLAHW